MDYRKLGSSDLTVSAICLGTMTFGEQNTESEAHAQLDYAFDRGVNFLDTAEMYPVPPRAQTCTRTESIVGNWLAKRRRDEVVVATKIAGPRRSLEWIRGGPSSMDRSNLRAASRPTTSIFTSCTGRSATCPCSASTSSIRARKARRCP